MDALLVKDVVEISLKVRARELRHECEQLQNRIHELEAAYQNKLDEVERLRRSIKTEQALKQSAITKLAQIGYGPGTISDGNDQRRSTKATTSDEMDSQNTETTPFSNSSDLDLQRRLLELELELVSKERENLKKHKTIIDHFEQSLDQKRARVSAKDEEIRRMRLELSQKQSMIDQLRRDKGFVLRTTKSQSSATSFTNRYSKPKDKIDSL